MRLSKRISARDGTKDKRILIVRGDGGREWLADALGEAGAKVEKVAAYRRIVPEPSMRDWERIRPLLARRCARVAVDDGSEGVRNLDELVREHLTVDRNLDAQARAARHAASAYCRGRAASGF